MCPTYKSIKGTRTEHWTLNIFFTYYSALPLLKNVQPDSIAHWAENCTITDLCAELKKSCVNGV